MLTLQHENSDFQNKMTNSWESSCSLWYHKRSVSPCKSCRLIADADLIYRPGFLVETITQLIAHWWKTKNILNKTFSNPLFKMMLSCVRIKYISLNINILDWIQIYFIEYNYISLNFKYFLLNIKIFLIECKYKCLLQISNHTQSG